MLTKLTGPIVHGQAKGRLAGFPTANLALPEGLVALPHGVYACTATVEGKTYGAVVNIGTCPTFGARPPHAETFVISPNFSTNDEPVVVHLLGYLREERTFDSAESLKMQINIDKNEA